MTRLALAILIWLILPAATVAQTPTAGTWSDEAILLAAREFNDRGRSGVEAYILTVLEYESVNDADTAFEPIAVEFALLIDDDQRVTSAPPFGDRSIAFTGPLIARSGSVATLLVRDGKHILVLMAGGLGGDPLPDLLDLTTLMFDGQPRGMNGDLLERLPRLSDWLRDDS